MSVSKEAIKSFDLILKYYLAKTQDQMQSLKQLILKHTNPQNIKDNLQIFSESLEMLSDQISNNFFNVLVKSVQIHFEMANSFDQSYPPNSSISLSPYNQKDNANPIELHTSSRQQNQNFSLIISKQEPQPDNQIDAILQNILVLKQREQTSDSVIAKKWKEARIKFFETQIWHVLQNHKVQEKDQRLIFKLFAKEEHSREDIYSIGNLNKHKRQIQILSQMLQTIDDQFRKKEKECLPLYQALREQINHLKEIHIQYSTKPLISDEFSEFFCYSIPAFDLFKILNLNKQLKQVIIKGVQVTQIQSFAELLRMTVNHKKITQQISPQQQEIISWMKNLRPSCWKEIQLTLNCRFTFEVCQADFILKVNDFDFFCKLFKSVSDLTVEIDLGQAIKNRVQSLKILFSCLGNKKILKIKLSINGSFSQIPLQSVGTLRQHLFDKLAQFTSINQLSFSRLKFPSEVKETQFKLIESALKNIFQKNKVTELRLQNSFNFPIFPQITTIESISLQTVTFRRQFAFMNQLLKKCHLRRIKCCRIKQSWSLNPQLLHKLQTLQIEQSNNITLSKIESASQFTLKNLQIVNSSNIGNADCLKIILPKLKYLSYLRMSNINFDCKVLQGISSKQLRQLHIEVNNLIQGQVLDVIDRKWPNISNISLIKCRQIQYIDFSSYKLNGLAELTIQTTMLGRNQLMLSYLKRKGIKVDLI